MERKRNHCFFERASRYSLRATQTLVLEKTEFIADKRPLLPLSREERAASKGHSL